MTQLNNRFGGTFPFYMDFGYFHTTQPDHRDLILGCGSLSLPLLKPNNSTNSNFKKKVSLRMHKLEKIFQ